MPTETPPVPQFDERLGRQFRILLSAVSRTPGHRRLYLLSGSIVLVIGATAAMQVALNAWNQPFYDAIARKDLGAFLHQLLVFFGIAGILLVLNVGQTGLSQLIRIKLRELATKDLIANWMTEKRSARISRAGEIGVNPDQRIQADAQHLTELTTDLGLGLLQSSILLASFIGVLWGLSQGVVLHIGGREFSIPGYMVWAALIYAVSGSWVSWMVGRPLVRLSATQYAREADFRFSLMSAADEADGIVLNGGEAEAGRFLGSRLDTLLTVLREIVTARVRLVWVTAGYGWVALVVPIIVAAPGYFGGRLSFGELMVVIGAFNQVQSALRWFVDNTGVIADWRATLLRVMNFRQALFEIDQFEAGVERLTRVESADGRLGFDDLTIITVHGRAKLEQRHVEVAPGERVLIVGGSSAGKSTLFLAIAGLWSWGSGRISLPPAADTMFLSQRPFLPAGRLRSALTVSMPTEADDARLVAALKRVGLGHLSGSLDRVDTWERELTLGEQERLALVRVVLARPKWLVCDEALDLMDETNRKIILSIFADELKETAVVNITRVAPPEGFYTRAVRLITTPGEKATRRERRKMAASGRVAAASA